MGTPYYEKAKLINTQAKFNAQFILGWEERTKLIDHIMSDDYLAFREMKDLFFLGLSYAGEEDTTAQNYCGQALTILEKIIYEQRDTEEALQFLKAHHIEFIDVFMNDSKILERLIAVDPERESTYREYLE